MTQTVSYERASISLYLLQMANTPVESWKRVTNNHNQDSNIRVRQPSVPSCLNISQIMKIELNKPTLKTSFLKKSVFSGQPWDSPLPLLAQLKCSIALGSIVIRGAVELRHMQSPWDKKKILTFSHSQSSVHTTLPNDDPAAHARRSATVMYRKTCP